VCHAEKVRKEVQDRGPVRGQDEVAAGGKNARSSMGGGFHLASWGVRGDERDALVNTALGASRASPRRLTTVLGALSP